MSLGQYCKHKSRCYLPSTHGLTTLSAESSAGEERVTPFAVETGPESVSSSSAAADMERQPPSTDQRAVSTIQHDEMEDVHNESKRAKIIGGMEVCVLDDGYDEWPDEPGLLLENQEGSE